MTFWIVVTFFTVLIVIFWIWLSVVLWSLKNGISPMPTSEKVKSKLLVSIPPKIHGTIIDLGSGWGNMAIRLAKQFPQCHVIGYETSPVPYYFSKIWLFFDKIPNLQFRKKNFFSVNLKDSSLIYTYLYPGAMKILYNKFEEELIPGTIVVSNTFAVPQWDPVQVLEVKDIYNTRIYMYVKSSSNIEALQAKSEEDVNGK